MSKMEFTISFFGDFVTNHPENIKFSNDILKVISDSDINCINFEAPITINSKPALKSGPTIKQSAEAITFIEKSGFNVVSLCNNHMFDFGVESAKLTKQSFLKSYTIGIGNREEAYKPLIIAKNGYRIAIFALCQQEFYVFGDDEYDCLEYGCAWVNCNYVERLISKAKEECDYVFVFPHCGVENIPIPEWRSKYKSLIDAGADAIIASHPHIIQGCEFYNGKPIYYSLGNFYFERESSLDTWCKGLVVTLVINETGVKILNSFIKKNGDVLELDPEGKTEFEKLCNTLNDVDEYKKCLDEILTDLSPLYLEYYRRCFNSISKKMGLRKFIRTVRLINKDYTEWLLLHNLIRCESHRWLFLRILKRLETTK